MALLLALAWWPIRNASRAAVWACTALLSAALAALPWLAERHSPAGLATLTLVSAAALPVKLLDSAALAGTWERRPWREWARFLLLPFVVCFHGHLREGERPRSGAYRLALRGLLESTAGAALLLWAFRTDWQGAPRLVECAVKLSGVYLLALDGAFVLVTGLLRLSGFAVQDLSLHPVAATTPADFWRRYNRDAGRFLFENVFWRAPVRSFAARTLLVFLVNGLLHEYLVWVLGGRAFGLFLGFFLLQGVGTALTARLRPARGWAMAGRLGTLLFMLATSTLVWRSLETFLPLFRRLPS